MPHRSYETRQAFHELLEVVRGIDSRFFEGPGGPLDEASVLEGYRWIPSILQVALDTQLHADPANPLFVDIVGPTKKWGGDNADAFYAFAPIDSERSYRVRGRKGDAVYLSLTVYGGPRDGRSSDRIVGTRNDRDLEIGPDGAFEILLSSTEQPGNWLPLAPDAVCAITRDYLVDPARGRRASWSIESLDPAAPPRPDDADLARRFRAAATFLREQVAMVPVPPPGAPNTIQDPYPVPTQTRGWAAGDAAYAMGGFELEDDQALVIRGRSPDCAFWNLCLWNPFLHTYDYRYERVTLNGGQTRLEEDGSWTIVVAARDPGHPNWVSSAGHRRGLLWFRWFLPEKTPEPLHTQVCPVAEVGG